MRVLVTGASGHIGSAVVPELLSAGHEVVGLARSDASAAIIENYGAEPLRGDIDDLDGLQKAAATSDGVIHLAFKHELGDLQAAGVIDCGVVAAIGDALEGTDKPFVSTSGTLLLAFAAPGRLGTELDVAPGGMARIEAENAVIAMAERGVRSSVVRLSPLVHSSLDHHGFAHILIDIARRNGVAGYVGDGSNRWPACNTYDAARLYRLALESAPAGTRLHGVESEGYPFRDIAAVIGNRLGVPTQSIPAEDISLGHFDFLGPLVGIDNPTSNTLTREILGWEPTHVGLLEDLEQGHYFAS